MSDKITQADISVLDYPECVRKRPGMYLNTPDQCIFEIIDNSVDEYMAGRCNHISIIVNGTAVSIADNGGGIPIKPSTSPGYEGVPMIEVALATLHAGGKFSAKGGYTSSTGGLNGVGASSVNAVSNFFNAYVHIGNEEYSIKFEKGIKTQNLKKEDQYLMEEHGTTIMFELDKTIWKTKWYDFAHIKNRLRQIAYLNPELTIDFYVDSVNDTGAEVHIDETFLFPEGIKGYVNEIGKNSKKGIIVNAESFKNDFEYLDNKKGSFEMAMLYTDDYSGNIKSFVNNVGTENGGEHLAGALMGIMNAVRAYALDNKIIKDAKVITREDCLEGLCSIISVKILDPNFAGQSKEKLNMPEIKNPVKDIVYDFFLDYLEKDTERAGKIISKALSASKAREAAKKARTAARSVKQAIIGNVPDLADCSSKNPEECEIFFVEGDSAGGSAKMARDRRTQAILPIFGKILNAGKKKAEAVVKSVKLADMVKALRTGIGDEFNIDNLRYHKIILMADADADGGHIQCLHITNFYQTMRPLIEKGYVYAACPPLYKVTNTKKKKDNITYLYTKEELDSTDTSGCIVQRYKGLGEMSSEQLWDTTMNPETRRLVQITIDDVEKAEESLNLLMGNDVQARRKFLLEYL